MKTRQKISRNSPCSCGSGLKCKRCCGVTTRASEPKLVSGEEDRTILERFRASEAQRVAQQGLGRPIVAKRSPTGEMTVTVGDEEFAAGKSEVFMDFLVEYFGSVLTRDWTFSEGRKPFAERHVIIQWFDIFNRQRQGSPRHNGTYIFTATGASSAFVGLAYGIYLLRHNAELQGLLVKRLKDRTQFQGAYFEIAAANALIRAGFELALEDETDKSGKHCEFTAKSRATGKVYSVECKSRSVPGQLHKTEQHASRKQKPLSQIKEHMRLALQKPSKGERIIFLEINAPGTREPRPEWIDTAGELLEEYEKTSRSDKSAYVFVSNMCYHWHLEEPAPPAATLAHGFNIPDFAKVGMTTLSSAWRWRRKHSDAMKIAEVIQDFAHIPTTFDGSLPSVTVLGERAPVQIGQSYHLPDVLGGVTGTVTSAAVVESEYKVFFSVTLQDGQNVLMTESMSEFQMLDYLRYRQTYFGQIDRNHRTDDDYEMFSRLVEIHWDYGREYLSRQLRSMMASERIAALSHEDLVLTVCELTMSVIKRDRSDLQNPVA